MPAAGNLAESPFDLEQIAACGAVGSLEYRPEVESTSDLALALADDDDRRWPLLVLCGRQTGGRGRGSNRWWSGDGALTFSLVVDARAWPIPLDHLCRASLVAGLAVCEALHALYPPGVFALKWPNDVYLAGRKVCGVLVEAPSQAQRRIVIGVGINVNNSLAHAPPDVQPLATSLGDAAGGAFDLTETLVAVLQRLSARLSQLATDGDFLADFQRYCLLSGQAVQVAAGRETVCGRCDGIDSSGALLLATSTGPRRLHSGTVVAWG